MATCPTCREHFDDGATRCPNDGELLLADGAAGAEGAGEDAAHESDRELSPGQMVGEYRIERKLGAGGFGTVYAAVQPVIGKAVALKLLSRQYSSSPPMVARFIDEARAVNQIRHRNIVDIFGFGRVDDGRQYYAMELLEGSTLDALIRAEGPLGLEAALPIFGAVARALSAAHAVGIVHRDLKPENVFVTIDVDGQPIVKLLDFGIAKLLSAGEGLSKTRTGAPIGTPEYMSPEQCRGRTVDHRTDVYAFGVMVHEALAGRRPFAGDVMELLVQHVHAAPPPLSASRPDLGDLDAAILHMLEKDPAKRPATMAAVLAELEEVSARAIAAGLGGAPVIAVEGPHAAAGISERSRAAMEAPTLAPDELEAIVALAGSPTRSIASVEGSRAEVSGAEPAPSRRRGRRWAIGAGGAVLAFGVIAMLARRAPSEPAPVEPAGAPSIHAGASAAVAQPPSASAGPISSAPPAMPATIDLTVRSTPEQADVYLGGTKIGTAPGPIRLQRGAARLALTLRAPRHKPVEVQVTPSEDTEVTVALVPLPARAPGQPLPSELEY